MSQFLLVGKICFLTTFSNKHAYLSNVLQKHILFDQGNICGLSLPKGKDIIMKQKLWFFVKQPIDFLTPTLSFNISLVINHFHYSNSPNKYQFLISMYMRQNILTLTFLTPSPKFSKTRRCSSRGTCECNGRIMYLLVPVIKVCIVSKQTLHVKKK